MCVYNSVLFSLLSSRFPRSPHPFALVVGACLWKDHRLTTSLSCEFTLGWLSWQLEERLSIWTLTVTMETKFLFAINNPCLVHV